MNNTEIRWTELTWNPASGCQKISPGCKHCYAETIAENKRGTLAFPNGFDLQLRPHKLREPFKVKTPSMIFVNSMSDLFWEAIDDDYRDKVVDVIEQTPQHQYQVLTKRHENLLRYSRRRRLPSNFWAGVTIESEEFAQIRVPTLLEVKAEIRFLSMEPILTHIDVNPYLAGRDNRVGGDGLQWLIFGGESGSHLSRPDVMEKRGLVQLTGPDRRWAPREDRLAWARDVRDACQAHGSLYFFKQWGGPRSTSGGKLLDGRTWEEFPRLPGPVIGPVLGQLGLGAG